MQFEDAGNGVMPFPHLFFPRVTLPKWLSYLTICSSLPDIGVHGGQTFQGGQSLCILAVLYLIKVSAGLCWKSAGCAGGMSENSGKMR